MIALLLAFTLLLFEFVHLRFAVCQLCIMRSSFPLFSVSTGFLGIALEVGTVFLFFVWILAISRHGGMDQSLIIHNLPV